MKKRIEKPADMPLEVYDYWHERWAAYLNRRYKDRFVQAGIAGLSFTEKCPDCPDGSGAFHYQFAADGTLEFTDREGDAVIEYDSYNIGYRLLGDETYDGMVLLEKGEIRHSGNLDNFVLLAELLPLLREALHAAIAETESRFDIELPRYW